MFGLNASLLFLAVLLLAVTPATVSHPITGQQVVLLSISVAVALFANALLIRLSLRPVWELAQLMENVDLLRPGQRLKVGGASEMILLTGTFNDMLDRLEKERRTSSSRSLEGQELERRRVATELHDEIGQGLTALLLVLRRAVDDAPPELVPTLSSTQEITRTMLEEVRRIARQLRPAMLDDLGLEAGLRALCEITQFSAGVEVLQRYDPALQDLSDEIELALYRTAQEALTNVARHADASRVSLTLLYKSDHVELLISDNGRGMIFAADAERGGIRSIRERAVAVGGTVTIDASPGSGTTIVLTVPIEPSRQA